MRLLRMHVPANFQNWTEELSSGKVPVHTHESKDIASAALSSSRARDSDTQPEGSCSYSFCLVMPLADRTLHDAISHERIAAGEDWHLVRLICTELCNALAHLHQQNIIHGDLKPHNAVRIGERWKLIDLDVSCRVRVPPNPSHPLSGTARLILHPGRLMHVAAMLLLCLSYMLILPCPQNLPFYATLLLLLPDTETVKCIADRGALWHKATQQWVLPPRDGTVAHAVPHGGAQ